MPGGCLDADLMGFSRDQSDVQKTDPMLLTPAYHQIMQLRIGGTTFDHLRAHTAVRSGCHQMVKPDTTRRGWLATNHGEVMLLNGLVFEKHSGALCRLLIKGCQEHTRRILVKPMDEPKFACRAMKAAGFGIIVAGEGCSLFPVGLASIRMRQHSGWLVDHQNESILVQYGTPSPGRGGLRLWLHEGQ